MNLYCVERCKFVLNVYSRTSHIRVNWDGEPSRYAENADIWIDL